MRQETLGLYAQNRVAWSSSVRTVVGVRADTVRASVASDRDDNSGRARDHLLSPKLALILGPWSKTEFYASAGQGFHSNDARGATITTDPASGARAERVPFLVRQRGGEVGVRSTALEGWTTTLAVFGLDSASELVFAGDAGTTEASRASRRVGVEWTNRYSPRPWLLFDVDVAQTRARFRDDDPAWRYVPGAPARIASASATIDPIPRWYGTLQLRHFGARPLIEDGSVRSNATTLLSGKVGYQFGKWLRVQLDAFNLQNRRSNQIDYYYESRLRGEVTAVADRHFHPVEPRSIRLALIGSY